MSKLFANLSKSEQAKVEADYHNMRPEDFHSLMVNAVQVDPSKSRSKKKRVALKQTRRNKRFK